MNTNPLPLTRSLTPVYALSFFLALLLAGISLAGLFFQSSIYPTEDLRRSFVSNDVVNLFIGLPILLGSMWLTSRGRLVGLLFWPGALFYATYNYIAYAVAMLFTFQFAVYLALVFLSVLTMSRLIFGIDIHVIQQWLENAVPERLAGGVLIGFGLKFFLWRLGGLTSSLTNRTTLPRSELALIVADLLITPIWVFGGAALWQRRAFRYIAGMGLLFQGSMLFAGLLIFFLLQPVLTHSSFPLEDFLMISLMGTFFFIPFGLFTRGVIKRGLILQRDRILLILLWKRNHLAG